MTDEAEYCVYRGSLKLSDVVFVHCQRLVASSIERVLTTLEKHTSVYYIRTTRKSDLPLLRHCVRVLLSPIDGSLNYWEYTRIVCSCPPV